MPDGRASIDVARYDAGTKQKVAIGKTARLDRPIEAGNPVRFQFEVTSTNPVQLKAKAWPVGQTSPAWQRRENDGGALQLAAAGTAGLDSYLSTYTPPTTVQYDNLLVQSVKRAVAEESPASAPACGTGFVPGWGEPDWRDEFSSGTSQWNVRDGESLSYDRARILARNVTLSDGFLNITAKRETVAGRDFTTGYLDTNDKFEQRYGRWEIRAQIPTTPGRSRGIWPAFWLRNDTVGEIDIMEAWGDPSLLDSHPGTSTLTIHESTLGTGRRAAFNWEVLSGVSQHSSLAFHTWAIEYTPTELRGYFDGKHVVTMTKAEYPWLWGPTFNTPLEMRLNLQIGSSWHGFPVGPDYADTKMPATLKIDYVRAWKLTE